MSAICKSSIICGENWLIFPTTKRMGAPLSLRWGLYVGDQIYPDAKRVYFQRFRQLLFAETQKRVTDNLEAVAGKSATNAPNDSL